MLHQQFQTQKQKLKIYIQTVINTKKNIIVHLDKKKNKQKKHIMTCLKFNGCNMFGRITMFQNLTLW